MPLSTAAASRISAIGLDTGTGSVKIVAVTQIADRIDVDAVGSFPLPPGVVQQSIINDPKEMGQTIKDHLHENAIQPAPVTVSIPSSAAVLRWVTLPLLAGDELREAARFKVKRHLPFPVNDAYVEASIPTFRNTGNNDQRNDPQAECLVIAVPKKVIDSRADAIECAGLEPVAAELEAQALLRVVERKLRSQSPLWRDATLTIIDLGANNTHMYVVQNQRLQFLRGVRVGSAAFANAVAREFEIGREEAEAELAKPTTELTDNGMLHMQVDGLPAVVNVQPELDKLMSEFLRLLRYFRSLHPERSYAGILDQALLCGGFAALRGFAEALQSNLGLRVETATPFAGMVAKFTNENFYAAAAAQQVYAVALGLALSGLQANAIDTGDKRARREFTWAR